MWTCFIDKIVSHRPEAHRPEDVIEVVCGEEVLLLDVEEVEAQLEHLDLVHLQRRRLRYLLKVDVRKLQLAGSRMARLI